MQQCLAMNSRDENCVNPDDLFLDPRWSRWKIDAFQIVRLSRGGALQVALSSGPENQRALDFASFQANYLEGVCKSNQNSLYLKVHLKLCLSM
ncbi:hypothetical protein CDAR_620521 [Caerostris darwini]|uniref:Uncharacterized protein n=1 Tax=Caerostris darwini TaxID=1538125 RepID=A0AAV4VSY8_9ARAC|nr:hypothetical protein CDAR_620521 [Caerostris darwini]